LRDVSFAMANQPSEGARSELSVSSPASVFGVTNRTPARVETQAPPCSRNAEAVGVAVASEEKRASRTGEGPMARVPFD